MAELKGTPGADTFGARNGATEFSDTIWGYGGPDKLYGLGGSDMIYGGAGDDTVDGGDVEDYLYGEDGVDTIKGGDGNDFMVGGADGDTLDGGPGQDLASYNNSPSGVLINLMVGKGWGGDAAGDTLTSIEGVYGSEHDDTFFGDDNGNTLSGEDGSDTIKGFGGDDYIWGGNNADTLYGMDGTDLIHGNAGKDHIVGGAGQDSLFGDEGADRFVWRSTDEALVNGPTYNGCNTDVIADFDPGEFDIIDLSAVDADVYTSGDQAFAFIGDAAFSGTPGELGYAHYCGNTFILMQTGTSPDVEGVIMLPGIQTPQVSWFEP